MASEEQPNPSKAEATAAVAAPNSGGPPASNTAVSSSTADIFSLDDLDKIIEAEDPEFKKELDLLKNQKIELSEDMQGLGISSDDDDEHLTKDEGESALIKSRQRLANFFRDRIQRAQMFARAKSGSLKSGLFAFFERSKKYVRHDVPDRFRFYKSQALKAAVAIKTVWLQFKALSRKQKLAIAFMSLAAISSLFVLSKTLTGHWLPHYQDSLPRSLANGAAFVRSFEKKDELQDLFLAFPEVEYQVLLKKVVVNLRPSASTGPNPMGTFELYIGVDSQDTAVEVKDRERELVDIVQRSIETFSYDDLATLIGKSRMKEVVRDHINRILNQGRVFHIYFSNFIIYNGS